MLFFSIKMPLLIFPVNNQCNAATAAAEKHQPPHETHAD